MASARFPIAEPFAGGMEMHTWMLGRGLRARGHRPTVFAGAGSDDRHMAVEELGCAIEFSAAARADVSMPPAAAMAEHHAYLALMMRLREDRRFDVVHVNCVHHLPVAMSPSLRVPVTMTLHTPPTPWLESALSLVGDRVRTVAVSQFCARQWRPLLGAVPVLRNGVDLDDWAPGPGGGPAVWTGRIVPEKGPHVALRAAHGAGADLLLAGAVHDPHYFAAEIAPLLDARRRYVGHLGQEALARLVGAARVALVTPMWDEPYGLVVAEALACGTPVAGLRRGAVDELVDDAVGVLVDPAHPERLAAALTDAAGLDRDACRQRAVEQADSATMIEAYARWWRSVAAP